MSNRLPKPGERWVNTTRRHQGQVVKIRRVTPTSVVIDPAGGQCRDQRSNRWSLPLPQFLVAYRQA